MCESRIAQDDFDTRNVHVYCVVLAIKLHFPSHYVNFVGNKFSAHSMQLNINLILCIGLVDSGADVLK